MMQSELTIMEIEAIYLIILAEKKYIDIITNDINIDNTNKNISYMHASLDTPIATTCNTLSDTLKKNINADNSVEVAQVYTYAEGYSNKNHMLMTIDNNNILSFPSIQIEEDGDPEKTIYRWLKTRTKKCPKESKFKSALQPVTLVGKNDEILVYAIKLDTPRDKHNNHNKNDNHDNNYDSSSDDSNNSTNNNSNK
jgi:hypothetical protein